MKSKKLKIKNLLFSFCIFHFAFLSGCYQPVLESAECIDSRDAVKRFYSFHFGNEMTPSKKYLEKREKFLSGELEKKIAERLTDKKDYFTQTADYPKAFRVGKCETTGKDKAKFEILLFWRNNEKNTQREIEIETIKEDNDWLIDQVTSEK
jgi:putative lipase involved disintegration of autophagic bodies